MDDFTTGPAEFNIYFNSLDSNVIKNKEGYVFMLKKPLEFPSEWEVGVEQLILRSPFGSQNIIRYTSPDNPDGKVFSKLFNLKDFEFPQNAQELLASLNLAVPDSLKKDFSLELDEENFVNINVANTQVKFDSDYLTETLGFKKNAIYPSVFPTQAHKIRADRRISMVNACPVFCLMGDFTLPEMFGSKNRSILILDLYDVSSALKSYKYKNISYHKIIRSYISTIFLSIVDIYGNPYPIIDPLIVKFHFRRTLLL